jgi:hypothetical protein
MLGETCRKEKQKPNLSTILRHVQSLHQKAGG